MKSFPKSEYWHFKISWKHCQENLQFSQQDYFGLQDFNISTRSYLTSCRGFGRLDFEISLRSYLKSCWDSRRDFGRRDFEISARISTRFWDLGENLGEFLVAEILRSRRDLGENLGEFLAAEILRSCWDLSNLAGQKLAKILAEILAEISPRSWSMGLSYLSSITSHFLNVLHWMVLDLFFIVWQWKWSEVCNSFCSTKFQPVVKCCQRIQK